MKIIETWTQKQRTITATEITDKHMQIMDAADMDAQEAKQFIEKHLGKNYDIIHINGKMGATKPCTACESKTLLMMELYVSEDKMKQIIRLLCTNCGASIFEVTEGKI